MKLVRKKTNSEFSESVNYYFFKQPPNLIGETKCFRVVSSVQNLVFWTQRPRNKFPSVRRLFFRRLSRNVSPIPINFRDRNRYPSILIHICLNGPLRVHFFKNVLKFAFCPPQNCSMPPFGWYGSMQPCPDYRSKPPHNTNTLDTFLHLKGARKRFGYLLG